MLSQQLRPSVGSSVRSLALVNRPAASQRTSPSAVALLSAPRQSRSYWSCRRGLDYTSHLDPMFYRFTRYRTLKTRAKLLEKLRRREKWDIDGGNSFFTSRHIRLASHWNGNNSGRSRWVRYNENAEPNEKVETNTDDKGYELSRREKEWKEQMEKMRKRIDKDPYEAIFGKRFEPFWSPLVPSWMREDMGLQGWPKTKEASSEPKAETKKPATSSPQPNVSSPTPQQQVKKDADVDTNDGPPNGQLTNYSYSSSTSWDSKTQKTRREEWDSITGQTRSFEYDPISNRMVQINAPKAAVLESEASIPVSAPSETASSVQAPKASLVDVKNATGSEANQAPVKSTDSVRKAIHVPTKVLPKSAVYFPSLLNTASAPKAPKSTVNPSTEQNLDSLTADQVRASVGKSKISMDVSNKIQTDLQSQHAGNPSKVDLTRSEWDRAETRFMLDRELDELNRQKSKLLKQEQGLFHIGKQQNDIRRLDTKIAELSQQMQDLDAIQSSSNPLNDFEVLKQRLSLKSKNPATSLAESSKPSVPSKVLQPSLERMQSKQLDEIEEPDDSAAHESTGDPIVRHPNIPKGWYDQADTLQTERIERTRGIASKQKLEVPRWIDVLNDKKAKYDAAKLVQQSESSQHTEKQQKASKLLEAEVKEQKSRMQAYENRHTRQHTAQPTQTMGKNVSNPVEGSGVASAEERYAQKIRDLRKELDIAFKQSSVQSEMQVETIRNLERELEKMQKINGLGNQELAAVERERYVQKICALRKELDVAFKQSSINGEMHLDRIRALETELNETRGQRDSIPAEKAEKPVEAVRGEGDFCTNITQFARDNSKWCKQSSFTPAIPKPVEQKSGMAAQKLSDRALVQEVKDIYEKEYGTIDYDHVQTFGEPNKSIRPKNSTAQVYGTEADTNLGKALESFEDERTYKFQDETSADIVAVNQAGVPQESAQIKAPAKVQKQILQSESATHQSETGEHTVTRVPQFESSSVADTKSADWGIQWSDPPVYKVLAYDSGNDLFSTATTSSNFTGKESPISIQQALSQLYQPARFLSHFSELQKEGFQVVYATKDLLVFKQVKAATRQATKETGGATNLQDHGLVSSQEPLPRTQSTRIYPGVNPIDGTSLPPPEKPSTGDFASPTGFVGDRLEAIESLRSTKSPSSPTRRLSREADLPEEDTEYTPYSRVKREEQVFTGTRLNPQSRRRGASSSKSSSSSSCYDSTFPMMREKNPKKWRRYRSRMRWAIGVGIGAAGVAYGIGAAAERKERKIDPERWQEILEGRRSRWE